MRFERYIKSKLNLKKIIADVMVSGVYFRCLSCISIVFILRLRNCCWSCCKFYLNETFILSWKKYEYNINSVYLYIFFIIKKKNNENLFKLIWLFIQNDSMEYSILQTDYYLLPLDLQVNFLFMVRIVQKAQYLRAGGLKLDVTTFVWVRIFKNYLLFSSIKI